MISLKPALPTYRESLQANRLFEKEQWKIGEISDSEAILRNGDIGESEIQILQMHTERKTHSGNL